MLRQGGVRALAIGPLTIQEMNKQPSLRQIILKNVLDGTDTHLIKVRNTNSHNGILLPTLAAVDDALYEVAKAIGDATDGFSFR